MSDTPTKKTAIAKSKSVRLEYSPSQLTELREIQSAEKALEKRRTKLTKEMENHRNIAGVRTVCGYGNHALNVELGHNYAAATFKWTETEERPVQQPHPYTPAQPKPSGAVHMDPKLLNILVTGSLLTKEAKAELIEKVHPGLNGLFKGGIKPDA